MNTFDYVTQRYLLCVFSIGRMANRSSVKHRILMAFGGLCDISSQVCRKG